MTIEWHLAHRGALPCSVRMRRLALACAVVLVASASAASAADAAISFTRCAHSTLQCARVPVPLDPTGVTPGTITLTVERKLATQGNTSNTALVALAGGPGQAAVPLAEDLAASLKDGLAHQDLIVFDQRGTGSSNPLKCSALDVVDPQDSLTALISTEAKCANQIGDPARLLHDRPIGRRHRGAARRRRLQQADDLRRLVRHEGRRGVRADLSAERRRADPRLGRHPDRARRVQPVHVHRDPADPHRAVRGRRLSAGATAEREVRPQVGADEDRRASAARCRDRRPWAAPQVRDDVAGPLQRAAGRRPQPGAAQPGARRTARRRQRRPRPTEPGDRARGGPQ